MLELIRQALTVFFILGLFVAIISGFVYAYRARNQLLPIEEGRTPLFTQRYFAQLGLLSTRGSSVRLAL